MRSVSGFFADARSAALKAFEEAYGALVLITACVHRRSNLNVIARLKMKDWIGIPLLWSLYGCATGPAFFSKAPWVTFRQGHASYSGFSRELEIKFEEYIPILESLRDYGYDTADIKASISHFLKTQSHALTLYFVMNPRKAIRLTRYLSIGVVLSIPRNAFHYVKRRYL